MSRQIGDYFKDLIDSRVKSALALVHQRFSTNTFPRVECMGSATRHSSMPYAEEKIVPEVPRAFEDQKADQVVATAGRR